jgi:2-methylcitrate dehydratase PrpD
LYNENREKEFEKVAENLETALPAGGRSRRGTNGNRTKGWDRRKCSGRFIQAGFFLRGLKFEDLPPEAVRLIRQDFLDYCGNTLGATNDPTIRTTYSLLRDLGGKEQCTVFGYGGKLPAPHAILLNGTMGFAVDYDDTHMQAGHVGVTCIPAALAVSELRGGVSGKEFIAAVAGGMELSCRFGVYNKHRVERHIFAGRDYTSLHGGFAATGTAGALMGFDEDTFLNALGLMYQQTAGIGLGALERTDSKMLCTGFAQRNAMTAILMAERGLTGPHSFMEGDYGFGMMFHRGCDSEGMARGLGKDFELLNIGFKPYASCRLGHRSVDAVRRLIDTYDIRAEEVNKVIIYAPRRGFEQLCDPIELARNPENRTAGQFSMPWAVACMLVRHKVGIGELSQEGLADQSLRAMAQKVFAECDESAPEESHDAPCRVCIQTSRGEFETLTAKDAYGDPGNPISQEDLEKKFYDNVSYAKNPVPAEKQKQIVDFANHLEHMDSMDEIFRLMV